MTPYDRVSMASPLWVLRAGDPAKAVFVVAGASESLAPIAERMASPKYFLVVGLADGIDALVGAIKFDVVVVLSDVPRGDLARIQAAVPSPAPTLLTDVTDANLHVVLRRHLG